MAIKTTGSIIIDGSENKYQNKTFGDIVPRRSDKNNCPWLYKSSGDTYYHCERTDTSVSIGMGIGAGGQNHGLWSGPLNAWLIYCDGSTKEIYINGKIPLRINDRIKCGSFDCQNFTKNDSVTYALHYYKTIQFGMTFKNVPKVFLQNRSDSVGYGDIKTKVANVTTTKFDVYADNGNLNNIYWDWVAIDI